MSLWFFHTILPQFCTTYLWCWFCQARLCHHSFKSKMNLEICLYAWWCLLWTFTSLLCGQILLHKESKAGHAKLKPFKFHTSMRKDIYKKFDHRVCIGSLSCSFIKLNQKIDFLNTAVIKVHVKNVTYTAGLPHREDGLSRCWNYWV